MKKEPQKQNNPLRKISKKKLFLLIAVAVVLVAGMLFLIIRGKQPEVQLPENKTVIHLTAGGDLNITDDVVAAVGRDGSYREAFMDVLHLLSSADLSVLNFEGNFCGAPYGSDSRSAPESVVKTLADAGVDMLQLANSCSIRGGISGLISTINAVKNAGIEPLGVYRSKAEASAGKGFTLMEVQGVRIAFVAFTKGMDGMTLPRGNEGCVNVLYEDYNNNYQKVDTAGITQVMNNVNVAKPDLVVAMVHWGSEFNDTISTTQNKICKLLQENGADVIIGTHPHYVQKITFDEKTGAFVAYSLGDFFGDATRAGSEYSILLDLEITKDNNSGKTRVTGYSYTPIFTVREEGKPLRVVRINTAMASYDNYYIDRVTKETYDAMKYALTRIAARTKGE